MEEESRPSSPKESPFLRPSTVTVRRNPHRRARPTPKIGLKSSSKPDLPDVPSFPIQDILDIDLPQNPKPTPIPSPTGESRSENLKVYLRIRPISVNLESIKCDSSKYRGKNRGPRSPKNRHAVVKKKSREICITANNGSSVTLSPPKDLQEAKRIKSEVFEGFSNVFHVDSSQSDVYENMVKPLVDDFLKGTSGMLAALGPSGSGKTYTVFGSPSDPGIVPLTLKQIFGQSNGDTNNFCRSFCLSMFQICSERGKGEKLFDLSSGAELSMQQSTIKGLQEVVLTDLEHAESLIASGMLRRATAMTYSNSQSSRSQCIINIRNVGVGDVGGPSSNGNLTFVDLAGAEREKKTGNQGERLLESNFINNTSMVFGLCLRSLLEHQKNPKRPLQKHFQSSLLTRYLRDYLEGKKRMALLLTVKPGEEDYLDSSHLLRQAAPFMKIKFNNTEESSAVVSNKRQVAAQPRVAKRAKVNKVEASLTEEGRNISATAGNENRHEQVVLHFARAMWNVLNQYKKKLKVAESEIENLRKKISNENTRNLELEKELKNMKASCTCIYTNRTEAFSAQTDAHRKSYDSASPKAAAEPRSSESWDEVDGKVQLPLLQVAECNISQNECLSTCRQLDDDADTVDSDILHSQDRIYPHKCAKDHITLTQNETAEGLSSVSGLDSADVRVEEESEIERELVVSLSSTSKSPDKDFDEQATQWYVEIMDEQPCGSIDGERDLDDSNMDNSCNRTNLKGLADIRSSSQSHALLRTNSCSTVELDDLQSDDEQHLKFEEHPSGKENGEADLEDSQKGNSFNTENIKDTVSSSQPPALLRKNSCSTTKLDDHRSDADEASSDLPAVPNEGVMWTEVSRPSTEPETALIQESSCQLPNPEKPRRRLLPASSVLLRNMNYWDIGDEEEKPKGNKGGRKKDAREEPRTKGNAALLRLLTGNQRL